MSTLWSKLHRFIGQLLALSVIYSSQAKSNGLSWPKGLYGLAKPTTGCPVTSTWESGLLYQDCEDTNPKTTKSTSYHLAGFVTNDVQKEFCIKTNTADDDTRPPWPNGQYCIYQKGEACPVGLVSGWVLWDDESEIVGRNKNRHNGTLPKGIYNTNTKIFFCCSTNGSKDVAIDLPVLSPFYLLTYRDSRCQSVRGATVAREFIYYEAEYYTLVTRNDYGGAHPYRATKSRYGHTIYYCYYTPKYCSSHVHTLHGTIYPSRCTRANNNVLNDTCSIHCNSGYVPRFPNLTTAVCGDDGTWDVDSLSDCVFMATVAVKPTSYSTDQHPSYNTSPIIPHSTGPTVTSHNTHKSTSQPATSSTLRTDRQSPVVNNKAVRGNSHKVSSVGRVIAGVICASVVAVGVVFFVCVAICRNDKGNLSTSRLEKSKSLEELVKGRNITMNRTTSSESLVFADPLNGEVQYCVTKIDDNPLYQSLDRPRVDSPERITDNVLYESVSPLILERPSTSDGTTASRISYQF